MKTRLEGYVDEKDNGNEEVGTVVDGIVPQAGLEFAQECELTGLGDALKIKGG